VILCGFFVLGRYNQQRKAQLSTNRTFTLIYGFVGCQGAVCAKENGRN